MGSKFVVCMLCLMPASLLAASVEPDGGSATTVYTDSRGRDVVMLAPANADRISHNTYTRFDVASNGVLLDNASVAAKTIINEVTSVNPSNINGELRVLGTRANVIIANPNGITLNGATFYNMGAVALSTGQLSYITRPNDLGFQDNPVLTTTAGTISIEGEGLSGVMNRLDILAKEIKVSAPLINESENALSAMYLQAGATEAEFNPYQSVADNVGDWYAMSASGDTSAPLPAFSVDITRPASLSAGSIQIMVNDAGAGVHLAGTALATRNNFSITTDGRIEIEGQIQAAGHLTLQAENIIFANVDDVQAKAEAQNGALLISADQNIENYGAVLSGATRDSDNPDSLAGVTIDAGNQYYQQTMSFDDSQKAVLFSLSDIYINALSTQNYAGRILANAGLAIDSTEIINSVYEPDFAGRGEYFYSEREGKRVWYSAFLTREHIRKTEINYGMPATGWQAAELISNAGNMLLQADRIENVGGDILLNDGSLTMQADTIVNQAVLAGSAYLSISCSIAGCDRKGTSDVNLIGGNWRASQDVYITAGTQFEIQGGTVLGVQNVTVSSPRILVSALEIQDVLTRDQGLRGFFNFDDALWVRTDQGGALLANMGKLTIDAQEDINVYGGQLDGGQGIDHNVLINIVREPTTTDLYIRKHGGLLSEYF